MKFSLAILVLELALVGWASAASHEHSESATVSDTPQAQQSLINSAKLEDLKDVLFDFDTHESASERAVLEEDARWLKEHPTVRFRLAGHTDVRGEIVYNLALSQRRAETVKQELIRMGIAEDRIEYATGWGELYPNCLESTENCWSQQRRVEFVRVAGIDKN